MEKVICLHGKINTNKGAANIWRHRAKTAAVTATIQCVGLAEYLPSKIDILLRLRVAFIAHISVKIYIYIYKKEEILRQFNCGR